MRLPSTKFCATEFPSYDEFLTKIYEAGLEYANQRKLYGIKVQVLDGGFVVNGYTNADASNLPRLYFDFAYANNCPATWEGPGWPPVAKYTQTVTYTESGYKFDIWHPKCTAFRDAILTTCRQEIQTAMYAAEQATAK